MSSKDRQFVVGDKLSNCSNSDQEETMKSGTLEELYPSQPKVLARREFFKRGGKALLMISVLSGFPFLAFTCNLSTWLTESANILKFITPLADGIGPIIALIDPALSPLIIAAQNIFDKGSAALQGFLTQWANASAAAQPGIMAQLEATLSSFSASAANLLAAAQVKNPTYASEIQAIATSLNAELSNLSSLIAQAKSSGGTTAALAVSKPSFHTWTRASKVRSDTVSHLKTPTGDPKLDAVRLQLASTLEAVQLN
jgi:hypothetical protein